MLLFGRNKNKTEIILQDLEQINKAYPNTDVDNLTVGLPSTGKSRNYNSTNDTARQLLSEEKETVHIYYEYEEIIKSIMDANEANMCFIPLTEWLARLKPFGFTDEFTEEQKSVVERLSNSIIRFASLCHYTIEDTNGFYLKDNQFDK